MNENDLKFNAIMSSCKYLLPCGRCEMTKKKCTADPTMTYTIQSREHRFDEWCTDCKEYDQERHCCPRFNHVIRTTLQEVQEAWKKGTWKREISHYDGAYHLYCSCCGECCGITIDKLNREWNFCPNCGADMRGEQDE